MKRLTFHSILSNAQPIPQLLPAAALSDGYYERSQERRRIDLERDQARSLRRISRRTTRQNQLLQEQMRRQEEERKVKWIRDLNGFTPYKNYKKTVPPGRDASGTWMLQKFRPPPARFCGCNWSSGIATVIVYRVMLPNGAPQFFLENNSEVNKTWTPL